MNWKSLISSGTWSQTVRGKQIGMSFQSLTLWLIKLTMAGSRDLLKLLQGMEVKMEDRGRLKDGRSDRGKKTRMKEKTSGRKGRSGRTKVRTGWSVERSERMGRQEEERSTE